MTNVAATGVVVVGVVAFVAFVFVVVVAVAGSDEPPVFWGWCGENSQASLVDNDDNAGCAAMVLDMCVEENC